MNPWPHQLSSVNAVLEAIRNGDRRICVTSPTGTGKSLMMGMLAKAFLDIDDKVVLYTNRKMLLEQSSRNFAGLDLEHGVRAAGHEDERWKDFQLSSIQTEHSRLKNPDRNRGWKLHQAKLVLCDEAHVQTGPEVRDILSQHVEMGGAVVGFTATPVDLGQVYDKLIVGCTMSEGRDCGALVEAMVYGPDEPDLKKMGIKLASDDYTENQQKKAMMTPTIFGRVWEWYRKLNPDMKPSIGFAPGVAESLYFAQEFYRRGVPSAHIDGSDVWINGERNYTSQAARDDIVQAHKSGDIKIIWNRFVMREGIDLPWAEHLILATIFGSVSTYLQTCGRGLRAFTGKPHCVIQDHGGNWHRFGSPNSDREWQLEYTSSIINGLREELLRQDAKKEPARCPQCALILDKRVCPCGFISMRQTWPRAVVQIDGTLKEIESSLYKKRTIDTRDGAENNWKRLFWGYRKSEKIDKTFRELIAYYQTQNNWKYPDPSWAFYPKETIDQFRKVKSVPFDRLNQDRSKS